MAARRSPARAAILPLLCAAVLCAAPKLKIDRLALHQFEDGALLDSDYQFLPGETAYFSCRLADYTVDENDELHRKVKLAWKMEVRDPSGVLIVKPAEGRIDTELLKEDTDWLPKFLNSFVVPSFAPTGEYVIAVRVHDEVGDNDVSGELTFHVKGHAIQPSPTLAVRNFMFLASENGTAGLREPVYHPGGMAWARMDVVGYRFGENNRFSVAFGMELDGPDGMTIFTQPDAGGESNQSFYPQSYAPGGLTLSLDKDVAPGMYTLVVTVRDEVGNQSVQVRELFRVE